MLSKFTGIGINPLKGKIKIDPKKALMTGLTAASFGGFGPLAGVAGKVGSLASKIPGATKAAGIYNTIRNSGVAQAARTLNGGKALTVKNTLSGLGKNVSKFGGQAFGAIKENPLEYAGAAAAGINAERAMKRAGDYSGKAVATAEQSYAERAPLRKLGVAGMSKPTARAPEDFVNTANPFARRRKVL